MSRCADSSKPSRGLLRLRPQDSTSDSRPRNQEGAQVPLPFTPNKRPDTRGTRPEQPCQEAWPLPERPSYLTRRSPDDRDHLNRSSGKRGTTLTISWTQHKLICTACGDVVAYAIVMTPVAVVTSMDCAERPAGATTLRTCSYPMKPKLSAPPDYPIATMSRATVHLGVAFAALSATVALYDDARFKPSVTRERTM